MTQFPIAHADVVELEPAVVEAGDRFFASVSHLPSRDPRVRVIIGDGRNFKYMDVTGEIPCTTSTFGDPARGTTKHCEVQNARYDDGGYSGGWTQCAREGERCSFSGFAQLRFGAAGRYAYRDGAGGVICSVDEFGQDPYPGRVKFCEIRR